MSRPPAPQRVPGVTAYARARMAERIGRDATDAEWLAIVGSIVDRKAVLVRRLEQHEPRREIYAFAIGDLKLRAVWDPETAVIVTVLRTTRAEAPPRETQSPHRRDRRIWVRGKRRSVMTTER